MGLTERLKVNTDGVSMVTLIALVACCLIIAVSVSAVVGAVTYAGWLEPGSGLQDDCQTPP